jgi:hypothetical protein
MIDAAIMLKNDWKNNNNECIKKFKKLVYEAIDDVSKFCNPKEINFELLLCALYEYSDAAEGILYEFMERIMNNKKKEYDKMPVQDVKDIYQVLEKNINSPFVFDKNTVIYCFHCQKKKSSIFNLKSSEITALNNCPTFDRGEMLFNFVR